MRYAIVKDDAGQFKFSKWHDTLALAQQEAERLCRHENRRFIVLAEIAFVEPDIPPIKWTLVKPEEVQK